MNDANSIQLKKAKSKLKKSEPAGRVELPSIPYHGTVLPLNYAGEPPPGLLTPLDVKLSNGAGRAFTLSRLSCR